MSLSSSSSMFDNPRLVTKKVLAKQQFEVLRQQLLAKRAVVARAGAVVVAGKGGGHRGPIVARRVFVRETSARSLARETRRYCLGPEMLSSA